MSTLLQVRKALPPGVHALAGVLAFALPILLWCIFSYVPFVWHPLVEITDSGDATLFRKGSLIEKDAFHTESARIREIGGIAPQGTPANPVYLPAPHEVLGAFYTAFKTEPRRPSDPWLHQSLWHSVTIIFWGFAISSAVGVPLGILCGTYSLCSRLTEPFIDFIRYMPAPAFGALCVAILGIHDAPKIAIIFIGTFFQQVLVISNTTRKLDIAIIEAAQTLGSSGLNLVRRVVVPGILPSLYKDMRILLGWAWTYLIVAELVGAKSGITSFIHQQSKYKNYDNVYAAIIMIGIIGLATDQILAAIGHRIFPWQKEKRTGTLASLVKLLRRRTA